jgi:TusA-related sulfurtransferase
MSPSRRVLDARGLACPQPVILTRKALAEGGFSELEVIVNTSSGRERRSLRRPCGMHDRQH